MLSYNRRFVSTKLTQTTSRFALFSCTNAGTRRSYSTETPQEVVPNKRTALYNLHVELGGKMVPYGGWDMPVQYTDGIINSHIHTRTKAGLFDVSHMAQLKITGVHRNELIERLTVVDTTQLPIYTGTYSLFLNEQGGIIDDAIVTNAGDYVYVVLNAGNFEKNLVHIRKIEMDFVKRAKDIYIDVWKRSLLSLQGPTAVNVLKKHVTAGGDITKLKFLQGGFFTVRGGVKCYIQRSGYTGEDGFEISLPTDSITAVARIFLKEQDVKPIGLGARDSLRLEAGLCLYGHDLDQQTTPRQAGLTWTISQRRQQEGGFVGAEATIADLAKKTSELPKRRVGFFVEGAPAREGATIHDPTTQEQIGVVTSGTLSPTLNKSISMGYVKPSHFKVGTELLVNVRDKMRKATVTKMPFVATKYKTE